jgi:hypothetical protein
MNKMNERSLQEPPPHRAFDGETYEPPRDHVRLRGQMQKVYDLMRDGRWRTIPEITAEVGGTPQSISARLRDFRKSKYGARQVERRSIGAGLFTYRLL